MKNPCPNCQQIFPHDEPLPPDDPRKQYVSVDETGDVLTLLLPHCGGATAWLFVFFAVLFFGACILTTILDDHQPVGRLPFSLTILNWLIYGTIGALSTCYAICLFCFSRKVQIDTQTLEIETFFCGLCVRRKVVDRTHVWGVEQTFPLKPTDKTPHGSLGFRTTRVMFDKTALEISCRSVEEQFWLSHRLKAFLERTAPKERLCCPNCFRGAVPDAIDPMAARCDWCDTKFSVNEALQTARAEAELPDQKGYPLRPLRSRIRIVQNDDTLHLHFQQWGVQSPTEHVGLWLYRLLGVACVILPFVLTAGLMRCFDDTPLSMAIFLSLLFSFNFWMIFGLLFPTVNCRFWGEYELKLTRETISATAKRPWLRTRVFETSRPETIIAKCVTERQAQQPVIPSAGGMEQPRHVVGLYFDGKRLELACRSFEELQWLFGLINRYLDRTGNMPQQVTETHPRPIDAIATVERTPETLTITVPSEISQKSPAVQRFIIAFQLAALSNIKLPGLAVF